MKINAQVIGLGPKFIVKVILQNTGPRPIYQSKLNISYDPNMYVMGYSRSSLQCCTIPVLLPGPKHIIETEIKSIDAQGRATSVLVILSPTSPSATPIVSATVRMPVSEMSL